MLRSSEFWMAIVTAIVGAVGGVLIQYKVLGPEAWAVVGPAVISGIGYVIARLLGKWAKATFLLLALCLLPAMSQAQAAPGSDPLLSWKRLSVAAGLEREVLREYGTEEQAWQAVIPIAYNVLSPPVGKQGIRLSLTARACQSLDANARPTLWVGARVTLWRGAQ